MTVLSKHELGLQWNPGLRLPGVATKTSDLRGLTRLTTQQRQDLDRGLYAVIERAPKPMFIYPGDWVVYLQSRNPVAMSNDQFRVLFEKQ